jgi:ankyrin repeat protein
MADRTPQLEELRKWLLEDDANVESFKQDPKPHLDRHNVQVTDDEVENLRNHLADKDVATIKMGLTPPAMATMLSQHK